MSEKQIREIIKVAVPLFVEVAVAVISIILSKKPSRGK